MHITTRASVFAAVLLMAACGPHPSPVPAAAAQPPLEVIASTRQIMLGITIPASDVVFQVAVEEPKDDLAWEKVQANALALAESGNLLMLAPRAVDQQEWVQFCRALIEKSKLAGQAAQAKSVDRVLEAGDQVYMVCDSCHKKYMAARGGV